MRDGNVPFKGEAKIEKITQPRILIELFPSYQKDYVIQDSEGDFWFFKERLSNGLFAEYSLSGKTLGGFYDRSYRAYLYSKFLCLAGNQEEVSVLIENIVSNKKRKHVGSWMINRLLLFLNSAQRLIKINKVYGHFLPDNSKEVEIFYRRFGFNINLGQNNRKILIALIEELKTVSIGDIKEFSIEDVVKEWFKSVKG